MMKITKTKRNLFIKSVTQIRDSLTEKMKELTSDTSISMDNAKLIKEITSVIKELDKLIRDQDSDNKDVGEIDKNAFYTLLKSKTLLDDNLTEREDLDE